MNKCSLVEKVVVYIKSPALLLQDVLEFGPLALVPDELAQEVEGHHNEN